MAEQVVLRIKFLVAESLVLRNRQLLVAANRGGDFRKLQISDI